MFAPGMFFGGWWWMLLFWILVIAGGVLVVRALAESRGPGSEAGKNALDILAERYARGEISQQEYQRMRQELGR